MGNTNSTLASATAATGAIINQFPAVANFVQGLLIGVIRSASETPEALPAGLAALRTVVIDGIRYTFATAKKLTELFPRLFAKLRGDPAETQSLPGQLERKIEETLGRSCGRLEEATERLRESIEQYQADFRVADCKYSMALAMACDEQERAALLEQFRGELQELVKASLDPEAVRALRQKYDCFDSTFVRVAEAMKACGLTDNLVQKLYSKVAPVKVVVCRTVAA